MSDFIRIALSIVLLIGVWLTSSWPVALCLTLLVVRCEISDFVEGRTFKGKP
jgi:hypothetical protein